MLSRIVLSGIAVALALTVVPGPVSAVGSASAQCLEVEGFGCLPSPGCVVVAAYETVRNAHPALEETLPQGACTL